MRRTAFVFTLCTRDFIAYCLRENELFSRNESSDRRVFAKKKIKYLNVFTTFIETYIYVYCNLLRQNNQLTFCTRYVIDGLFFNTHTVDSNNNLIVSIHDTHFTELNVLTIEKHFVIIGPTRRSPV